MGGTTRWLGPYKPTDRYADPVTLDHIVKLKKHIEILETQLSKALDKCVDQEKTIKSIKSLVRDKHWIGD
jgi:CO dehydrogenase/acetyl-CoA synthase epsilon subunit